ncbi:MAG: DUF4149 domain-containing protein [Pseudomonadota bacterium]
MTTISLIVIAITTGLLAGAIVFQSAIVAPAVFKTLGAEGARDFLRALFPRLFRFGIASGLTISVFAILLMVLDGAGRSTVLLIVAGVGIAIAQSVALKLVPAINAARDLGSDGAARFHRLHTYSVALTLIALLIALIALGAFGATTTLP